MRGTRLEGVTVLVTGVTRGFGRAVAEALVDAGALVVGTGRSADRPGPTFVPCDVPDDPRTAQDLLRFYAPDAVVLCRPDPAQIWVPEPGCLVVTVAREPAVLPEGVRHIRVWVPEPLPDSRFPEVLRPLLVEVRVGTQVTWLIGEALGPGWSRLAAGYAVTGSGLVRLRDGPD
ncbi:hypothetical protein GCM10022223_45930 [Kineosporia mesophila]|uniref:Short subunit dehydrogenase n=1 Tax=Kineosporia mesophila TaxID=566012 RepID=A0ABP7A2M3_9ACTN|nr:hypothetical protein [Kineosporia mesophila]MCD5349008.1 hypothetical protein [Kineosporia mesophila]